MSRLKILGPATHPSPDAHAREWYGAKTLVRAGFLGIGGLVMGLAGCSTAAPAIPQPRPIVIHSGVRIRADHEEMKAVNEWVTREDQNITEDPSFLLIESSTLDEVYPWEGLVISEGKDSVTVQVPLGGTDARLVYRIYAHQHLMVEMGRQEEWLPEAPTATGFELERAILERCADAWILGRTVFDTQPFGPMDELAYSAEAGFLDAFIFTARPNEFASARTAWVRENPGRMEAFRDWFLDTFSREPPGLRSN